jgi:hypothetical protein
MASMQDIHKINNNIEHIDSKVHTLQVEVKELKDEQKES